MGELDLHTELGEQLLAWASSVSLSAHELAMLQPSYDFARRCEKCGKCHDQCWCAWTACPIAVLQGIVYAPITLFAWSADTISQRVLGNYQKCEYPHCVLPDSALQECAGCDCNGRYHQLCANGYLEPQKLSRGVFCHKCVLSFED